MNEEGIRPVKPDNINTIKARFYEFQRQYSETSNIHNRFQARQGMLDMLMLAWKNFPCNDEVLRWVSRNI